MSDNTESKVKKLGYQFKNSDLLELALTHRSANSSNNERLEFLGDALLGAVIAEALFQKFSSVTEGVLTRQRAALVKKETLAELARKLELGDLLVLGPGEKKSGGWRRDSILANTLEALIGGIYLDSDFLTCRSYILDLYAELLSDLDLRDSAKDSKTELQEYLQARKLALPRYTIIDEEGEAHQKSFTVICEVDCLKPGVKGTGKSKRNAEQAAALETLRRLQETS